MPSASIAAGQLDLGFKNNVGFLTRGMVEESPTGLFKQILLILMRAFALAATVHPCNAAECFYWA